MKNTKVTLAPLTADDREQFILDNQEAFKYGAVEEFGMRDDHFEEDGEIISRKTIEKSIDAPNSEAYRILFEERKVPGYTIEGQEPIPTNRTAIEVLNELSGGAFALQDKKPSVLGKLAASKEDMKKAPSAGAKKKEEPAL